MTCEHCVRAVSSELRALNGVTEVTVDLVPGGTSSVAVESAGLLTDEAVAAALDEAGGYRLGPPGDGGALPSGALPSSPMPLDAAGKQQLRLLP
jgi:copper chaperone CopZ